MRALDEGIAWLFSLTSRGTKLGLENTRELLARLGDPQDSFRSIHVAGTDGKGSVCAMMHSALVEAGVVAGLYTSPHLLRLNERIVVGRDEVSDEGLESLIARCRPVAEEMAAEGMGLTFFEIGTAMAFLHFADRGAEFAVVETGLGGRLDSTNVLIPELTVITPVEMEHKEYLGHTLREVAREKAGIIKKGVPLVCNCSGEVLEVVSRRAKEQDAPLHPLAPGSHRLISMDRHGITMEYAGGSYRAGISGSFQVANAATALLALQVLDDPRVGKEQASAGLRECRWPCRMELVAEDPPTVVDVTHTALGAESLMRDFPAVYGPGNVLVIGVLRDKDVESLASMIGPGFRKVIATEPDSDRGMAADAVGRAFIHHCDDVTVEERVGDAIAMAYQDMKEGEAVLVTGSFYTAGDALKWLRARNQ